MAFTVASNSRELLAIFFAAGSLRLPYNINRRTFSAKEGVLVMLQTADGLKTFLQGEDLIVLEKPKGKQRIVIYRRGQALLINGKPYFEFPRAKNLLEQFK